MEPTSLDALAERIARIGRRDAATAVSPSASPDQVQRVANLLDQAVARMSQEIAAVETRNADAVTRSELRAAKALDSVAVWLEKRDGRDSEIEKRIEERDFTIGRTLSLLTSRLEDIDNRLAKQPGGGTGPMRDTVQDIEQRLERVIRNAPRDEVGSAAMAEALRDLDRRMQDISQKLEQDQATPRRIVCDQTEVLGRLESQLSDVLSAVRSNTRSGPATAQGSALYRRLATRERDFAAAISDIAARQAKLDAEPAVDNSSAIREIGDRTQTALNELKREIGTLATRFADPTGSVSNRSEVRAQIMAISHALHDLAPRKQLQGVETALRDLAGKIESSRNEGTRESLLAPIERLLTDIRLNLESYRDSGALDQINERLEGLQRQMENDRRKGDDPRALESLTRQLSEIRSLIANGGSDPALGAIERRLSEIGARLDDVVERSPARERDPDIADAILDIRALLDRADPGRVMAEVEAKLSAKMQEHSRAMEARFVARERETTSSSTSAVSSLVSGLAQRLDSIQEVLAHQGDQQEDFERIARQVALLEEKIDTLPQRQGDNSAVVDMVRQLAGKLESVEARMPDVIGLADIVHKLADQVDAALANSHAASPANTEALEAQIAAIAARLDRPMDGAAALPALEKAVGDLFTQIEGLRIDGASVATDAAREAMQAALESLSPEVFLAAANEGVAALAGDIQALRDQQGEADRRSQDTLASVHDTLGKIVDRLAMLETDIAEAREASNIADVPAYSPPDLAMASITPGRFSSSAPAPAPETDDADELFADPVPRVPVIEPAPVITQEPDVEPAKLVEKSTSFVLAMRQKLTRAAQPPTAREAPPSEIRSSSFLDSDPADLPVAEQFDHDDADLPLEPGTGRPKRSITEELAPDIDMALNAPSNPTDAARNDFLKLARQAMSGTSGAKTETPSPKGKAERGAGRKDRISALELNGTAKASTARRIVPLLGAAAVVAAAGIGGTFWMKTQGGEGQPMSTNAVSPASTEDIAKSEQPAEEMAPTSLAPPVQAEAPAAAAAPAVIVPPPPVGAAEPPIAPEAQKQSRNEAPLPSAKVKTQAQAAESADDMADDEPAAPKPRKIDTTSNVARSADGAINSGDAINPDAFAKWPVGQAIETTDSKELVKRITAQAEKGDAAAQYDLAARLAEGRDMERDPKAAAKWFEKAANKGLAPAQFRLGSMYREGKGFTANNARAMDWFKRAAQRGNARAMHNLAVVMAEGVGGAPDYATAGEWFRKGAEYGIKDSQYNVAILYARGLGLPQDLGEAYKWFDAAAKQGDEDAAKKRDEIAAKMDARRLTLAKSEAESFKPKALDPVANDVIIPSYGAPAAADGGKDKAKG